MANLHRDDVVALLGQADDILIAEIIGTGATQRELAEAQAWISSDDVAMDAGRHLPEGRVGQLVALLRRLQEEESEEP